MNYTFEVTTMEPDGGGEPMTPKRVPAKDIYGDLETGD